MLNLVLSLSLSHTGHWKFNMAPHGKELSEDLKKRIVALHKSESESESALFAKCVQTHIHTCIHTYIHTYKHTYLT